MLVAGVVIASTCVTGAWPVNAHAAAPKARVVRDADRICRAANRQLERLDKPFTRAVNRRDYAGAARVTRAAATLTVTASDRIAALGSPPPAGSSMRRFVKNSRISARLLFRAADAYAGRFIASADDFLDRASSYSYRGALNAARYGLKVCDLGLGVSGGGYIPPPSGGGTDTTPTPPTPVEWPSTKKGWTVVLLTTTSKDDASDLAIKARDDGVPAGILQSDNYKNLSSGLWLVWAGRFGTEDEAYAAATGFAGKGYDGESVEYIRRKAADDTGSGTDNGSSDGSTDTTDTTDTTDGG